MIQTYIDIPASVKAARTQQTAYGMVKVLEDLERYERVIAETRPDMVIECGSWTGHSALWFSHRVDRVISIDIDTSPTGEVRALNPTMPVMFIEGSSTDPHNVRNIAEWAASCARVMVVLDSDHRAEHVAEEIRLYGPLVSPGCYLVVEDGIAEWMKEEDYSGPLHAIEGELVGNSAWRRDTDVEQLTEISMHPAGWWVKR